MTSLSNSPQEVALVQASTALPIMLFSLMAGAIADNLDRRIVMLCAQVYMVVVSLLLAFFAWNDWLTPWGLLGFTFAIACGTALNNPAWQASVGDMVPRSALPGAVALNSMGFNIARSVGPAIGGAIVAVAGAAGAFLTNARELCRPDRRPVALASGKEAARAAARADRRRPWRQVCAMSPCRRTSASCCCGAAFSAPPRRRFRH